MANAQRQELDGAQERGDMPCRLVLAEETRPEADITHQGQPKGRGSGQERRERSEGGLLVDYGLANSRYVSKPRGVFEELAVD